LIKYKELEKYLSDMLTYMVGSQWAQFSFHEDVGRRFIVERQNRVSMPDATTIGYFRVDNLDNWRAQRYGRAANKTDEYGREYLSELRTFKMVVTILSKNLGDAFDTSRFILANIQNNRYNEFATEQGRIGIENVSKMKNLSELETGAWTERIQFEITMNYYDTIVIYDPLWFVNKPATIGELETTSIEMENKLTI